MATNLKTDQDSLNERLRSLKIDRAPESLPVVRHRVPKKLLLALSVVIALAVFAYFYFFSAVKTITAAPVKIESGGSTSGSVILSASGYVVAHHKIAVGAKVMGRVAWIGVEKGDRVQQGQVLVRLEDQEFRAQVNQAKANLAAAQARLDQLRAGSRPQEKLKDKAAVLQAEANLKNAEAEYDRAAKLFPAGIISKADLDRAVAQRDAARAAVEAARQSSSMTDIGPRTEEISAGAAQVKQMQAALDYANTQLAATEIKAPVSGTVLERIVERGEMVTPSAMGEGALTSVVSLADLNDLQIELDISQQDFARLKMGQRAEIIPEAFQNLRYSGFIAEIAPEANRAKATVQVKVKVENPDEQLRPEMNALVNFLSEAAAVETSKPAARVMVPKTAVVHRDGSDFVFVVKGNRVEQRVIRVGETAGEFYNVIEGLSGGESAAVTGIEKLRDGDRVKVISQ
jgi:HlyD family secretion protein